MYSVVLNVMEETATDYDWAGHKCTMTESATQFKLGTRISVQEAGTRIGSHVVV